MNAFFAVIPLILVRYLLPGLVNRAALRRLAFTPPVEGKEKAAFWVYEITTALIVFYPLFLLIEPGSGWVYAGLALYCLGIGLYALSIVNYARPDANGMNAKGLYRVSRNPMYVAFFLGFLGIALLARSWILLALTVIYQFSAHWIILSEERWCIREFGAEYLEYRKNVRRYI